MSPCQSHTNISATLTMRTPQNVATPFGEQSKLPVLAIATTQIHPNHTKQTKIWYLVEVLQAPPTLPRLHFATRTSPANQGFRNPATDRPCGPARMPEGARTSVYNETSNELHLAGCSGFSGFLVDACWGGPKTNLPNSAVLSPA